MKRQTLFKLSAAALASTLLCGYSTLGGLIEWAYFGTPTGTSLHPYNTTTGAPTMAEYSRSLPAFLPALPADLRSKVAFTLPEGRDIRLNTQGLVPDSDDKTNIRFSETADVWVTFISEGAGYRNSVGYFTYDPANPPTSPAQVQEKIIFVNASMPSPLDTAGTYQNTVRLGTFQPGQALGFVIVSDGFSSTGRLYNGTRIGGVKDNVSPRWVFYTLRGLNPEAASPQNLNVHTIMLKDASGASEGYQRVVLGFEDINRETGGDHDFNDVVLAVHVTPGRAIQNLTTLQTLVAATDLDSDGDGVKDALDEFPNDATRAFSRYYPGADSWGTLAYEDQWPQRGDYDMNDVVMRYRTREIMNAARQVVGLDIDYQLQARGGLTDSGFGVNLPGVPAGVVASATLATAGRAAVPIAVESGQTEATFIVTPSVQGQMPISSNAACPFANTRAGCATVAPVPYRLELRFTQPQPASLFSAPYNPFIYKSSRRGQEVHLPGKAPTQRADRALLGTGDDRTVVGTATTYMDAQRRPWALDIPVAWSWPLETTDLLRPYPRFADWALTSGAASRDWYLSGIVPQHLASRP
jgi:LruC domain-containing protein